MTKPHLFIGPTLSISNLANIEQDYVCHPPAVRGSIATLIEQHSTAGIIVLVDGLIEQHLAVSHKEIINAVESGWQVWGLADIGAIRAYELRHHGVMGFGEVYRQLIENLGLRDDEILWCNGQPVHEPMIHLAAALSHLYQSKQINESLQTTITNQLHNTHYKQRTFRLLFDLISQHQRIQEPQSTRGYQIKAKDLESFIQQQPFLQIV